VNQTRKLYYEDGFCREFTARVTGCSQTARGWQVTLDATAFYPEGGGQGCDTGYLDGVQVLAVSEENAQILHLCDGPLAVGQIVTGRLDWEGRFDRMQQHTGEHMVSGLVCSRYGCHNVGFHMGADVIQIDFDALIPASDLPKLEAAANEAIWQDLPVECFVPSPEELPGVFYRSKRPLPWPVRIVRVAGVDSCACCGVHTATTGQVGLIKLLSCVKFHQGVRIELVCGKRAYDYVRRVCDQNREISQELSAKPLETAEAVRRLNKQLSQEKFRATGLQSQLLRFTAQSYSGQENVVHFEKDLQPAQLRELAQAIAGCCTGVAVVCAGEGNSHSICMARPGGDVKALGQKLCVALPARGGGKDGFFQGTVGATEEQIREFFRSAWENS